MGDCYLLIINFYLFILAHLLINVINFGFWRYIVIAIFSDQGRLIIIKYKYLGHVLNRFN